MSDDSLPSFRAARCSSKFVMEWRPTPFFIPSIKRCSATVMCSASCKQAEKDSTLPHKMPSLSPKIISPGGRKKRFGSLPPYITPCHYYTARQSLQWLNQPQEPPLQPQPLLPMQQSPRQALDLYRFLLPHIALYLHMV